MLVEACNAYSTYVLCATVLICSVYNATYEQWFLGKRAHIPKHPCGCVSSYFDLIFIKDIISSSYLYSDKQ